MFVSNKSKTSILGVVGFRIYYNEMSRRLLVNDEVQFVHVSYNKYGRHELMACYLNFQDFTNNARINPTAENTSWQKRT